MRIMLSYGHDEHCALARRLKCDLEGRGHEVWFDETGLRAGGDWEVHIEQGIDWVSQDPAAGRLVLVMTPHAVRRPDGYCLNELARAISRRLTIVPVMLVWTEPPLSICRIQWLDMQDCIPLPDRSETYQGRLALLLEAIEQNRLDFDGAQSRLLQALRPLPFEAEMVEHVTRFSGRQWALREIDSWLADPCAEKLFWVVAEPGMGKSALACWLSQHRGDVAAVHLFQRRHAQKSDPCRCVLSIAYQLSSQLPDYAQRLAAMDLAEVSEETDPGTLFDRLISQPLAAGRAEPGRNVVIVLDALDEAGEGGDSLASFLSLEFGARTPPWLRLIVTSRNELALSQAFQGVPSLRLDRDRPENREDLELFLRGQMGSLVRDARQLEEVTAAILARSEGSFLYAEWVRREVAAKRIPIERAGEFPAGLGRVFAQHFQRQFPDVRAYATTVRPALEVLAAALAPLSLQDLAELFGWDAYTAEDFRRGVLPLVEEVDGCLRVFHSSIYGWLTDAAKAGAYFVSMAAGGKRLADAGLAQFRRDAGRMSAYHRDYLPAHLLEAQRWEELAGVLCCEAYVHQRLGADVAAVHAVIADYRDAVTRMPKPHRDRLWTGPPSCVTLALRGVGAVAGRGQADQAIDLLDECRHAVLGRKDARTACLWHRLAARAKLRLGKAQAAYDHLSQSLRAAQEAGYGEGMAKALLQIALVLEFLDEADHEPLALLEEALQEDFAESNPVFRAAANLHLARMRLASHELDQAEQALGRAGEAVERSTDPRHRLWLLKYAGCLQILRGRRAEGEQSLRQAADEFDKAGEQKEADRCRAWLNGGAADGWSGGKVEDDDVVLEDIGPLTDQGGDVLGDRHGFGSGSGIDLSQRPDDDFALTLPAEEDENGALKHDDILGDDRGFGSGSDPDIVITEWPAPPRSPGAQGPLGSSLSRDDDDDDFVRRLLNLERGLSGHDEDDAAGALKHDDILGDDRGFGSGSDPDFVIDGGSHSLAPDWGASPPSKEPLSEEDSDEGDFILMPMEDEVSPGKADELELPLDDDDDEPRLDLEP